MYRQDGIKTWMIALCFCFSRFKFPIVIGIILLIIQYVQSRDLISRYGTYDELKGNIEDLRLTINDMDAEKQKASENITKLNETIEKLKKKKAKMEKDIEVSDLISCFNYSSFESYSSEECKNKLATLKQEEKILLKDEKAVTVTFEGTKRQTNNVIKQIIRCFNSECDNIVLSVSVKNIETLRNKIAKSFDSINKIFK